jgi:hypothetical protein
MRKSTPARFIPIEFFSGLSKSICLIIFILSVAKGFSQEFPEYDELSVEMHIPKIGMMELPIAIKDQDAYLSVKDLFDYLRIKNESVDNSKVLTGFLLNPDAIFRIDPSRSQIVFKDETFQLKPEDFIQTPTTLYLRSDYFGKIFALNTDFSFRSLSINLDTELELPIIREKRLQKMRDNLDNVRGIVTPDTIMERSYPFFKAGMADWAVITTQQTNGQSDNRFNLGLGTMIAGGETNVLLNYSTKVPFTSRNQFYQWRYVNNDSKIFKQITAGKIFTRATSSLFAPVVGAQVSNSPLVNRRSFGTYTLSDVTEPGWMVELYVNNVLVNFVQADASGFYSFEVPLMYGNTMVNLRFYGPYGEERTEDRAINIPYNFVPKNELEYTLSAGMVEDDEKSKFSRLNFNYGLSNTLTFGGGVEYLSGVTSGEVMPFVNTSVRIAPGLLFSGEYTYKVKADGLLSYKTPSNFQIDLNYINYDKDQTAINFNYLEERKLSMSMPIRNRFFSAYTRFSLNQVILPTTEFTTAQLLLSGVIMGISTNLTTYGLYNDRTKKPTIYSTLSQTYRLPYQLLFSPQIQYDFSSEGFTNMTLKLERPVFEKGFMNLGYEHNFQRNTYTFQVGLRYLFDFAQTSATSRIGNQNSSFVESARGSFLFDDRTKYLTNNNRSSVGKGAITVIPFLDLNLNGEWDKDEPNVPGLKLKNLGGRLVYSKDKTIIRIYDLQPYVQLLIEIDPISLDNIAWKVRKPVIAVETLPNQFKTLHIPIEVLGEVAGMVYFKDDSGTSGQGRIIVNILDKNDETVARILTEGDGYFTYLGLKPGKYKAVIDADQLENLSYSVSSKEFPFEILIDKYGDIEDTLEFVLEKKTN